MNFYISRNGQVYGPYTLDDLRRYVASGNVLPSDLCRSDGSADWLPAGQVLASIDAAAQGGATAAAYPAPTYAAPGVYVPQAAFAGYYPAASAVLANSAYPEPPNLPWIVVALISLVTGGLFMYVWNIVIAAWLRRVQPNATSLYFYIAALVLKVLSAGISISSLVHQGFRFGGGHPYGASPNWHGLGTSLLLGCVIWVIKLMARFMQKASLEAHFNGPEPIGLRLSGVMVYFFGGLYFQYHLSRIAELRRAARVSAGLPYQV